MAKETKIVSAAGAAEGQAVVGHPEATEAVEPRVVEAVGTAVRSSSPTRSDYLTEALTRAVEQAHAEGITDPDEIKARKAVALEEALAVLDPPAAAEPEAEG